MPMKQMIKNFVIKLPKLLLLAAILLAVAVPSGSYFGLALEAEKPVADQRFNKEDAARIFTEMHELRPVDSETYDVFDSSGKRIGYLVHTFPDADNILGFATVLPVLIGIDAHNKIKGIVLQKNGETPGYIKKIVNAGFFDSWNGMSVKEALNSQIDAVTRATMTTQAIIDGMQLRLGRMHGEMIERKQMARQVMVQEMFSWLLLVLLVLSWSRPKKFAAYRVLILAAAVLILGFWRGSMLSLPLINSMVSGGVPLLSKPFVAVMVLLAFVLPILTNKAFYCPWVCPYGALQELAGKLKKKKYNPTGVLARALPVLRTWILAGIVFAILVGLNLDLNDVEPFSAFMIDSASDWAIGLALVFILLAVFVARPWCRFFCPTGELLEILRSFPCKKTVVTAKKDEGYLRWHDLTHLLLVVVIIILLLNNGQIRATGPADSNGEHVTTSNALSASDNPTEGN